MFLSVRGGVSQDHQWLEPHQRFDRLLPLHFLRFIQNQNGLVTPDNVNGFSGLKIVQFIIDASCIFPGGIEGLDIDDHGVYPGIRRKTFQIVQLLGVVDEIPDALSVVLEKMFCCHLKGFMNALANRNTGHHDDELTPAKPCIQFKHGFDIAVSLTGARFHLDIEIDPANFIADEPIRAWQILATLNVLNVFQ